MNPCDIIVVTLTPGTPFNPKGKIFRSVKTLAAFTGLEEGQVMELLVGDLAHQVVCKPSPKKTVLVALKAQLALLPAAPIAIAGGNAFVPPAHPLAGAGPLAEKLKKPEPADIPFDDGDESAELYDELEDEAPLPD